MPVTVILDNFDKVRYTYIVLARVGTICLRRGVEQPGSSFGS